MKEKEIKELFTLIFGNKKKKSCCGNIEIEEIPENQNNNANKEDPTKDKGNSYHQ